MNLSRGPKSSPNQKNIKCRSALEAIKSVGEWYAQNPRNYNLGYGPIESLANRYQQDEINFEHAVKLAKQPSTYELLSPDYVKSVSWHGEDIAQQGNWRYSVLLQSDISQITVKSTPTVPNFHRYWNSFTSAAV